MTLMDTVIPEGCEALWNADSEALDPAVVIRRAADRAAKGRPQAVQMPGGEIIVLKPEAA